MNNKTIDRQRKKKDKSQFKKVLNFTQLLCDFYKAKQSEENMIQFKEKYKNDFKF